jgi:hypothetical protein
MFLKGEAPFVMESLDHFSDEIQQRFAELMTEGTNDLESFTAAMRERFEEFKEGEEDGN